jgi:hypothetical protein
VPCARGPHSAKPTFSTRSVKFRMQCPFLMLQHKEKPSLASCIVIWRWRHTFAKQWRNMGSDLRENVFRNDQPCAKGWMATDVASEISCLGLKILPRGISNFLKGFVCASFLVPHHIYL